MPQPAFEVQKYLSQPLPHLREQYPPGTGGTGPRASWDGSLKGVEVIEDLDDKVKQYFQSESVPKEAIQPHPKHKYPNIVQVHSKLPPVIKSPSDLQTSLSTLPLAAVSSVLTALDADKDDIQLGPQGARALDTAGYESDGGEELEVRTDDENVAGWVWKFNKSPLGSGEFLLVKQGSNEVKMVVRTINSSAFSQHDWDEYVVTGPYHYNTKSKASWYWSRSWGACERLGCKYYVLTDWQRWVFGAFDEKKEHGWVSSVKSYADTEPSVGQALLYWAESALGDKNGFRGDKKKDVSSLPALFPDNPARRVSVSRRGGDTKRGPKKANESDIEESDVEAQS